MPRLALPSESSPAPNSEQVVLSDCQREVPTTMKITRKTGHSFRATVFMRIRRRCAPRDGSPGSRETWPVSQRAGVKSRYMQFEEGKRRPHPGQHSNWRTRLLRLRDKPQPFRSRGGLPAAGRAKLGKDGGHMVF